MVCLKGPNGLSARGSCRHSNVIGAIGRMFVMRRFSARCEALKKIFDGHSRKGRPNPPTTAR
jgi:hypothetical protein